MAGKRQKRQNPPVKIFPLYSMLTFHTFNCVILQKNNHDRNEIDLDLQKHLLLFAYKIYTFLLFAWHIT